MIELQTIIYNNKKNNTINFYVVTPMGKTAYATKLKFDMWIA